MSQLRAWSRRLQLDAVPRSPEGFFVDIAGKTGLGRRTGNDSGSIMGPGGVPQYTAPRPYSPQRQPVFMRNASRPYNPQAQPAQPAAPQRENSLIGPVGYDVQ